jgi:4-hydroxy-tetrahydrodipicolinate reductase
MGKEVVRAVQADPELELVGGVDINQVGADLTENAGLEPSGMFIENDLSVAIKKNRAEVVVDFTHPSVVFQNIITALESGAHMVVGTTGLKEDQLPEIEKKSEETRKNVFIAPNFSLGAVLMIKLAEIAAQHFPEVEIIELHHEKKADAPSGTALLTAEVIEKARRKEPRIPEGKEVVPGCRGGKFKNLRIHSVRLPGLLAHQEVIFGGYDQTLTIRHDTLSRKSFMPGVLMAIKAVQQRPGLTYGLDKIL